MDSDLIKHALRHLSSEDFNSIEWIQGRDEYWEGVTRIHRIISIPLNGFLGAIASTA